MTSFEKPGALEKAAGGLPAQAAMTVIAALAGGALAPLLPILTTTLASKRQQLRVEQALQDISNTLASYGERLNEITDSQYKLVNETILALLQTADQEKIDILRVAIGTTLEIFDLDSQDAYFLSRLVRDISVQEVRFLQRSFGIEKVTLVVRPAEPSDVAFEIQIDTLDGRLAAGLISLGLLAPIGGTIDDLGTFRFTPVAAKLLTLLHSAS